MTLKIIVNEQPYLTEANFILYAAGKYSNPSCYDTTEFFDDLNRFKYLKRLFNQYCTMGELKERLILNHIMVLYNVFGIEAATRMLFLKLKGFEKEFIPFLVLLNVLPEAVYGIGEDRILFTSNYPLDGKIVKTLREI